MRWSAALLGLLLLACDAASVPTITLDASVVDSETPDDAAPREDGEDGSEARHFGPGCTENALTEAIRNARDLADVITSDGPLACGQIYRSSAPSALSERQCADIARLGVHTVIDLRVDSERENVPNAACLAAQVQTLHAPLPVPYSVSASDYLTDLDSDESMHAIFAALGDPSSYPVLFHCTYGRDRSGVVAALILSALGASRDAIMRDYQRTEAAGLTITPDSLRAVLDELDQRGGGAAHLAAIGVTQAELATLRAQLLEDAR